MRHTASRYCIDLFFTVNRPLFSVQFDIFDPGRKDNCSSSLLPFHFDFSLDQGRFGFQHLRQRLSREVEGGSQYTYAHSVALQTDGLWRFLVACFKIGFCSVCQIHMRCFSENSFARLLQHGGSPVANFRWPSTRTTSFDAFIDGSYQHRYALDGCWEPILSSSAISKRRSWHICPACICSTLSFLLFLDSCLLHFFFHVLLCSSA